MNKNRRIHRFLRSQAEESRVIRQEEKSMTAGYRIIMQLIKWMLAVALAFIGLFVWGCGGKTVTVIEYKEVMVPVKCQIETPVKPEVKGDTLELTYKLLEYAKRLETALKACK